MSEQENLGKVLIIIAIALVPIAFLVSGNYQPNVGFLTSFYYSMTVVDLHFCDDGVTPSFYDPSPEGCFNIVVLTKYFVAFGLLLATYGFLIAKSLIKSPIPLIRSMLKRLWKLFP